MIWLITGAIIPSMVVSWLAMHVLRRKAESFGLVDRPAGHKAHQQPTPAGGGIGIWLGVVVPLALGQCLLWWTATSSPPSFLPEIAVQHLGGLGKQSSKLWLLVAAATVLMLLGLADDRRGLDWKLRLSIQTAVAAVVVAAGWRLSLFVDLPWLTNALSVLWIVALINAFNMLDNMDGLSGGVGAIAAAMLAAVMLMAPDPSTHQPQLFVAGFLLVLVGALLGFLGHNCPPARIFMGDAGSYFIGFWIATGTLMATFAGEGLPRHAILAPLCVLAVPLYDTTSVVLIRLRRGHSPFQGDNNHFSHRLVDLGLSRTQAVLTIYLTTATTSLGALLLYQVDATGAIVIGLMVVCVLLLIAILETTARRKMRNQQPSEPESKVASL